MLCIDDAPDGRKRFRRVHSCQFFSFSSLLRCYLLPLSLSLHHILLFPSFRYFALSLLLCSFSSFLPPSTTLLSSLSNRGTSSLLVRTSSSYTASSSTSFTLTVSLLVASALKTSLPIKREDELQGDKVHFVPYTFSPCFSSSNWRNEGFLEHSASMWRQASLSSFEEKVDAGTEHWTRHCIHEWGKKPGKKRDRQIIGKKRKRKVDFRVARDRRLACGRTVRKRPKEVLPLPLDCRIHEREHGKKTRNRYVFTVKAQSQSSSPVFLPEWHEATQDHLIKTGETPTDSHQERQQGNVCRALQPQLRLHTEGNFQFNSSFLSYPSIDSSEKQQTLFIAFLCLSFSLEIDLLLHISQLSSR